MASEAKDGRRVVPGRPANPTPSAATPSQRDRAGPGSSSRLDAGPRDVQLKALNLRRALPASTCAASCAAAAAAGCGTPGSPRQRGTRKAQARSARGEGSFPLPSLFPLLSLSAGYEAKPRKRHHAASAPRPAAHFAASDPNRPFTESASRSAGPRRRGYRAVDPGLGPADAARPSAAPPGRVLVPSGRLSPGRRPWTCHGRTLSRLADASAKDGRLEPKAKDGGA